MTRLNRTEQCEFNVPDLEREPLKNNFESKVLASELTRFVCINYVNTSRIFIRVSIAQVFGHHMNNPQMNFLENHTEPNSIDGKTFCACLLYDWFP